MHIKSTLSAVLLAGQIVTAAYIPIFARHEEVDSATNVVTITHVVSLTTYVAPAPKTSRLTSTFTRTSYTTVYPKSNTNVNPINGLPVPSKSSSTSVASVSFDPPQTISWFGPGPEPANPTAKPSMFQTKPFISSSTKSSTSVSSSSASSFEYPYPSKETHSSSPTKSASTSTSETFEYPYPTKETSSSSAASASSSKTFEYPYPTKETKSSSATTTKASETFEYPYPTKESKTSSASDAKKTNCAYPYPGCDE